MWNSCQYFIFFSGLLDKNCTAVPDTCLKRKRQLVSKPVIPTSVTISVSQPSLHHQHVLTNSPESQEPNPERSVDSLPQQLQNESQINQETSQIFDARQVNGSSNQAIKKDTLSLPYTKNRISSTSSDKQSESSVTSAHAGNQATDEAETHTDKKSTKKKCKKKKRKSTLNTECINRV